MKNLRARLPGILATLLLLAGSFALFQFTELDVRLQDRLFDFKAQQWMVDKNSSAPRWIFYNGPKFIIIGIGAAMLVATVIPARLRPARLSLPWPRRNVILFLVCLAAVPGIIGALKSRSDLYCPWALERFGGDKPYHHFFDPLRRSASRIAGGVFPQATRAAASR